MEGLPAEQREDERDRWDRDEGDARDRAPDHIDAVHQARRVSRDELDRCDDEHGEDRERDREQREEQPDGPDDPHLALAVGSCIGLTARQGFGVRLLLLVRSYAVHGRLDDPVGVLVDTEQLEDHGAGLAEGDAEHRRERHGNRRDGLDRVGHDGGVDVGVRGTRDGQCRDEHGEQDAYNVAGGEMAVLRVR